MRSRAAKTSRFSLIELLIIIVIILILTTMLLPALRSAQEIVNGMGEMTVPGSDAKIDCAIGVAFGDVTYGNIGSRERLDFTVIGGAANIAARLGDYGKVQGHRIVVTDDVAEAVRTIFRETHVVAEGSGALPLAAALKGAGVKGKTVCLVSGGNIDASMMSTILAGETPA